MVGFWWLFIGYFLKQIASFTHIKWWSFVFLIPIVLSDFLNVLIVTVRDWSETMAPFQHSLKAHLYSHIDHYGYANRVKHLNGFGLSLIKVLFSIFIIERSLRFICNSSLITSELSLIIPTSLKLIIFIVNTPRPTCRRFYFFHRFGYQKSSSFEKCVECIFGVFLVSFEWCGLGWRKFYDGRIITDRTSTDMRIINKVVCFWEWRWKLYRKCYAFLTALKNVKQVTCVTIKGLGNH